ncbi:extracellular solute-binding protein [Polycladidibacter hongkongensis]|uniref:extracellular solute-binding protein n=1 Tax=Polycladidibacter hongkongensis TaxID=1647556 RepID=UPI001AD91E28|nr:extracellular solute-binding protein [Pseudovibrio hongkongensis]
MKWTAFALSMAIAAGVISLSHCSAIAANETTPWRHAVTSIGTPKYSKGFKQFDYVNPDAPKGGLVRLPDTGSFDTLNPILRKGTPPAGLGLVYERLMVQSLDETVTEYGLIAEAIQFPKDFAWVKFRINPEAKWHDGTPITAEDVVWSFNTIKENNPRYRYYYKNVVKAEATAKREVLFTFDTKNNLELPNIVGQVMVLPKHWWTGKNADGEQRDITKTTLEPPLGSGPYKIGKVNAGRSITYERVADYWGKDLNVNIGSNNFDQIRYEVFLDETVALEALKGDQIDRRQEATAKLWATAYDIPAVQRGWMKKQEFTQPSNASGLMAAFIPNLRKEKFQDRRVRQALNYALDFESLNRDLFFDLYSRIDSYYYDTALSARGLPKGQELSILNEFAEELPEGLLQTPYKNPVAKDNRQLRENLRKANDLLKAAGYVRKGDQLVHAKTGEPLTIEYLLNGNRFEKIGLRYQAALARLGIEMTLRPVDTSQYVNRVRARDFDMIYTGWVQSLRPGNEQREYWGSAAAEKPTSSNYAGIKNPLIDKLIERLIISKDYEELKAATRALDRVLLWNSYVIPGWTSPEDRYVVWDRFSHPQPLPQYSIGFPTIWWFDKEKAAKIAKERAE